MHEQKYQNENKRKTNVHGVELVAGVRVFVHFCSRILFCFVCFFFFFFYYYPQVKFESVSFQLYCLQIGMGIRIQQKIRVIFVFFSAVVLDGASVGALFKVFIHIWTKI